MKRGFEVNGANNTATIFTDNVDNITISQIVNICNQESFKDSIIKIMPDCHSGKGAVIGTTMTINCKIIPNLVGVDIGCGVATIKVEKGFDLERLDNIIREYIPYGFNVQDKSRESILKNHFGIDLKDVTADNVNNERNWKYLGSLGGGNHYIELNSGDDCDYLTVHTGSRGIGKTIAEHHQKVAIRYCKNKYFNHEEKDRIIKEYKRLGKEKEIAGALKEVSNKNSKCPADELCYLEDTLMKSYIYDMDIAQRFAKANRVSILCDILYHYYDIKEDKKSYYRKQEPNIIECIHNYLDIENMILRKGAISAQKDETVLIPINMKDGIILGVGKGSKEWNYSAPHGAGRIYSRSKAKENISLEEFEESMQGIYTTCVKSSTLDEAPQAYKPLEEIVECIEDTVEIQAILKPIYNFKSN